MNFINGKSNQKDRIQITCKVLNLSRIMPFWYSLLINISLPVLQRTQ